MKVEFSNEVKEIKKDAEETLEKIRNAAAESGITQHAVHFKNEADANKKQGWIWLGVTGILVVLTILFAWKSIDYFSTAGLSFESPQLFQIVFAKVFIFAVLYYSIIWAGQMFKALMHNYVVNKHRQNALNTFETFIKSTKDEQIKNAVLLQATNSIFSPQPSGYSNIEVDQTSNPRILEIIRGAPSGPK